MKLILASGSPRRREILTSRGFLFDVVPADVAEETCGVDVRALPEKNAAAKADAVFAEHPNDVIIGADTAIVIDDILVGKPNDLDDARRMLRMFSGRRHDVVTGMAVRSSVLSVAWSEIAEVVFRRLSDADIEKYLQEVNVLDKAGAYAVQEHGELIVEHLSGDVGTVIGLPMGRLECELFRIGISPLGK